MEGHFPVRESEVFVLTRFAVVCSISFSLVVLYLTAFTGPPTKKGQDPIFRGGTDEVTWVNRIEAPVLFAQVPTPPASPCTIVSYAPCNYLIPPNDYVAFDLAPAINFAANCPSSALNTVNITFEATPSAPMLVWLQTSGGTNSTAVYMTTASITLPTGYFGTGTASWFNGGPWTKLCVQVIYPTPPPTTFYYPQSCTIVYQ
jgi:hypothetical protein